MPTQFSPPGYRWTLIAVAWMLPVCLCPLLNAQDDSSDMRFLRLRTVDGQPLSLDTALVTYSSKEREGVQVDLIGAVHVGEAEYYAALNKLFDSYDVVLYELVAAEGTEIPLGGKKQDAAFNPISLLQDGIKNMLGLESQLEKIDYTKPHLVRADMSPAQLGEKMAERGDTAITLALDTLVEAMRQANLAAESDSQNLLNLEQELSLSDLLDNPLKMKRIMAEQFVATGSLDMAMGKTLNQLLIVDRNAEALRGLQKQMAAGKKRIGIFYGAAHLPDLERQLIADFGLERSEQRWLPAWNLTESQPSKWSQPAGLLLNVLKILE